MRSPAWGVLLFAVALAGPVRADIYYFVDKRGVAHFSNIPDDPRYKLYLRWQARLPKPKAVPIKVMEARRKRFIPVIEQAARSYQLETALLHAVISAESGYDPNAVSRKGAMGLMQLMPETAERYGVIDRQDPAENIRGGAQYLHDLLQMFNDDLTLAVAAYNAGEGAVVQYGNRIPPFPETQDYVTRVMGYYQRYQKDKLIAGWNFSVARGSY
jgi:soluble lytic murein transglycosylase-like protein